MRLPVLSQDRLGAEQRRAWQVIAGPRHRVVGPYQVLLQRPELAIAVANLGEALRFSGTLPAADRELAILATGREWNARFEWATHLEIAERAGVRGACIDALRTQAPLDDLQPRERIVIGVARALCRTHAVDDALYAAAVAELGAPLVVELVTLVGFYCLISSLLVGFAVEPSPEMPATF